MSIKHMYYRLYQGVFRVAVNFLDWTPPKIISGPGSVKKLPQVIKEKGLSKMMIVTDKGLTGLNLLDGLYFPVSIIFALASFFVFLDNGAHGYYTY